jgi:hypothetical protein
MLSVYYKIWVDAIRVTKAINPEKRHWKPLTIIPISVLQGINMATVLLWIKALDSKFTVVIPVRILNVNPMNTAISLVLTFFLPFVIFNYLLILYDDRYLALMQRYRPRSGRRYFWYIAITLSVFALPYILQWIF